MNSRIFTRRDAVAGLAAIPVSFGLSGCLEATAARAAPSAPVSASPPSANGVSRGAEAIHQEIHIKAPPGRIYGALLDPAQFDKITQLSGATKSAPAGSPPTQISQDVGGSFVLFGGYITGRHLDLAPGQRLVQAWRSAGWPPGDHSIVKFVLGPEGDGTKIVFDHTGFPDGAGDGLAGGWHEHYWNPLRTFLA